MKNDKVSNIRRSAISEAASLMGKLGRGKSKVRSLETCRKAQAASVEARKRNKANRLQFKDAQNTLANNA